MDSSLLEINRHAGVIVLYERSSDCFILTKRASTLRHHPNEVCFPGGLWEEKDSNYYATALRELEEELDIKASRITVVKALATEKTLTGALIHPWLATIDTLIPYKINQQEVSSVVTVSALSVKDPQNYKEIKIQREHKEWISYRFLAHTEFIWGATAKIMKQLSCDY